MDCKPEEGMMSARDTRYISRVKLDKTEEIHDSMADSSMLEDSIA